jgi:OmpA-OmpF porin, OOP family
MFRIARSFVAPAVALILAVLFMPQPADGQVLRRLRDAAARAAEREVTRQIEVRVTNVVRCAFDDLDCLARAEAEGKPVEYVNDRGEVIVDDDGAPVSDRDAAAAATAVRPGEGAWANWDFVPGEEVLFSDDYADDRVGDFPRRWELIAGNVEIVEWGGARYVQLNSTGIVALPLPRTLPERFTVETSVSVSHGNARVALTSAPYLNGPRRGEFQGSAIEWARARAGLTPVGGQGPQVDAPITAATQDERVVPVRVMADGEHMKVYWDDRRVANAPNAVFPRSDTLYLAFSWGSPESPILVGPVRVAGGGLELYDRLARDGRVATQGILFATGSHRIRPESTPVLQEIVDMLGAHPDLRLRIEGHTDDVGEADMNQALSERRAEAVREWLVTSAGIDAGRLEAVGLGESQPAMEGTTPEARAQNRRVELVDLRGGDDPG